MTKSKTKDFHNSLSIIVIMAYCFVGLSDNCNASNVEGYLITQEQDTLKGHIRLPWISPSIDFFNLFGFDEESLTRQVFFKGSSDKKYHCYTPLMISEFGFDHRRTRYIFRSFDLKYKSIVEDKSKGFRFLNLIYHGAIDLYSLPVSINYPQMSTSAASSGQTMRISEYYLWSDSLKLLWVGPTDQYRALPDLLKQCRVDEAYCSAISKDFDFKDIWQVLNGYDKWLKTIGRP